MRGKDEEKGGVREEASSKERKKDVTTNLREIYHRHLSRRGEDVPRKITGDGTLQGKSQNKEEKKRRALKDQKPA